MTHREVPVDMYQQSWRQYVTNFHTWSRNMWQVLQVAHVPSEQHFMPKKTGPYQVQDSHNHMDIVASKHSNSRWGNVSKAYAKLHLALCKYPRDEHDVEKSHRLYEKAKEAALTDKWFIHSGSKRSRADIIHSVRLLSCLAEINLKCSELIEIITAFFNKHRHDQAISRIVNNTNQRHDLRWAHLHTYLKTNKLEDLDKYLENHGFLVVPMSLDYDSKMLSYTTLTKTSFVTLLKKLHFLVQDIQLSTVSLQTDHASTAAEQIIPLSLAPEHLTLSIFATSNSVGGDISKLFIPNHKLKTLTRNFVEQCYCTLDTFRAQVHYHIISLHATADSDRDPHLITLTRNYFGLSEGFWISAAAYDFVELHKTHMTRSQQQETFSAALQELGSSKKPVVAASTSTSIVVTHHSPTRKCKGSPEGSCKRRVRKAKGKYCHKCSTRKASYDKWREAVQAPIETALGRYVNPICAKCNAYDIDGSGISKEKFTSMDKRIRGTICENCHITESCLPEWQIKMKKISQKLPSQWCAKCNAPNYRGPYHNSLNVDITGKICENCHITEHWLCEWQIEMKKVSQELPSQWCAKCSAPNYRGPYHDSLDTDITGKICRTCHQIEVKIRDNITLDITPLLTFSLRIDRLSEVLREKIHTTQSSEKQHILQSVLLYIGEFKSDDALLLQRISINSYPALRTQLIELCEALFRESNKLDSYRSHPTFDRVFGKDETDTQQHIHQFIVQALQPLIEKVDRELQLPRQKLTTSKQEMVPPIAEKTVPMSEHLR